MNIKLNKTTKNNNFVLASINEQNNKETSSNTETSLTDVQSNLTSLLIKALRDTQAMFHQIMNDSLSLHLLLPRQVVQAALPGGHGRRQVHDHFGLHLLDRFHRQVVVGHRDDYGSAHLVELNKHNLKTNTPQHWSGS